jgi:hypothetical protein
MVHGELDATEPAKAQDVLDRLAGGAALDVFRDDTPLRRWDQGIRGTGQGATHGALDERFCVCERARTPGLGETLGSQIDGRRDCWRASALGWW